MSFPRHDKVNCKVCGRIFPRFKPRILDRGQRSSKYSLRPSNVTTCSKACAKVNILRTRTTRYIPSPFRFQGITNLS